MKSPQWWLTKVFTKRNWVSAETESVITTLGVEFLCAWAWPMSLLVYAPSNSSLMSAWLLGWLLYFVVCSALRWTVTEQPPAISGAYVMVDLLFENDDRPRAVAKESYHMLFARLGAQWMGALIGNGFIEVNYPQVKTSLARLLTGQQQHSFYTYVGVQILFGALQGAFSLRVSQTDGKKQLTQGLLWDSVRSGTWLSLFLYPWGGVSFSIISCVWMQRVFYQSSAIVLVAHLLIVVLQGLGAKLFSEVSYMETAEKVYK